MKILTLRRLNILSVPKGVGIDPKKKMIFLAELANLGFRISNPELLDEAEDAFFEDYQEVIKTLERMRGYSVKYVPLFKGFPNDVPDQDAYFVKRLLGFVHNIFGFMGGEYVALENGINVPKHLFDVYDFGADPITQFQSKELFDRGVEEQSKRKTDTHVEWIDLRLFFDDERDAELKKYLCDLLYAKSSIKEVAQKSLKELLSYFGPEVIDVNQIVMKETLAFVLNFYWEEENYDAISLMCKTPTDILRLFAAVSNSDVGLTKKIRFPKCNRKQRRVIFNILEKSPALAEDLKRYKDLWLKLGTYLHPGEYKKKFPKTYRAFDLLRNGKIRTFNSVTERLLAIGDLNKLLNHLEKRPGVFVRKFHELLRKFPANHEEIIEAFEQKMTKVPVKSLLILSTYLKTINKAEKRTIVNKKGKVLVFENKSKGILDEDSIIETLAILNNAILKQLESKESWEGKKVFIDPSLCNYTVPLQQRKASDALLTVGRGSQVDIDLSKVIRLFVYWKEYQIRTDLDLSVMQFDEHFKYVGHVAYTNLKDSGIVHSGDIQSAPHGASEFIDITVEQIKKHVRYLAVQVFRYCGENFHEMECHAGWMLREEAKNDVATFDAKTVQNKFDMMGRGDYAFPLLVDLQEKKIISTDLFMSGLIVENRVEGAFKNVALVAKEIQQFLETRPNMYALSLLNLEARKGELVSEIEEADYSIGLRDCDLNVTEVERVLAELI